MRRGAPVALALAVVLALVGCLRVGPGEDLHLVCEEKSASPRMAYGLDFLAAETVVESNVSDEQRLALLEEARHHVVTPRGAPHAGFAATLADDAGGWLFHGVGAWEDQPQDDYWVRLGEQNDGLVALARDGPGPVQAPRTLVDAAWAAANGTPELSSRFPNGSAVAWGAWDPALPSCVRIALAAGDAAPEVEAVANIVQGRIVDLA